MAGNNHEWVKWAFDGTGGAALLAVIGWLIRRRKSELTADNITDSPNVGHTDTRANSLAVGPGASLHGSHIVLGSNNTINLSSPQTSSKETTKEEGGGQKTEILTSLVAVASALTIVIGALYFSYRTADRSWTAAFAKSPIPITDIGIAFGNGIPEDGFDAIEEESCIKKSVTCLGEANIKDKAIHIPFEHGESWARIVLLITTYNVSNFVEDPHIVVSTPNTGVGLNYPDHRDGLFHNRIEFTPEFLHSTSYYRRPESFSVDITLSSHVDGFPLTIAVWGDGLPQHAVTTQLRLLRHLNAGEIR